MEKILNNKNSLIKKLTTPLGFGVAIVASAALGFGLAILRRNLSSAPKELSYKVLLQMLKKKIKEEKGATTYSKELIDLYYRCYPDALGENYKKLVKARLEERLKVIDDIPKYIKTKESYQKKMVQVMGDGLKTLIVDNGGSAEVFVTSDTKWKAESKEIAELVEATFVKIRSVDPVHQASRPLTVEFMKEVIDYQVELLEQILSEELYKQFRDTFDGQGWVSDKIFQKYGVNVDGREFNRAIPELVEKDKELEKSFLKVNNLIRKVCDKF